MELLEINLPEILSSVPGRLINAGGAILHPDQNGPYSEMVFDSRKTTRNSIFLCFKGEKVDGHDFIDDAVRQGARLVIGDDEAKLHAAASRHAIQFLVVEDPLIALQKLATFYRRKFNIPIVGLTGSSGKTTTKDLLGSILNIAGPALVTEGTLNNHWGVPQMVMRLRRGQRTAVFELGTSGFGEIENLSSICQPDIGYITTIGSGHLQTLKDEQGVLRAKRELFDWIVEHGANRVLIFNLDVPLLEGLYAEFLARKEKNIKLLTVSLSRSHSDVRLLSKKPLGLEHRYGFEYEFATPWGALKGRLPLPGAHNLANAMGALTLALATGVANAQDVVQGLDRAQVSKLRSNLFKTNGGTVIYDDSYNANPTSVTALFEAARLIRTNSKSGLSKTVAVVGDMLELGPDSADLHRQMGRRAALDGVDVLLATGTFADAWVEGYRQEKQGSLQGAANPFSSQEDLMTALQDEIRSKPSETMVLVKGSRGAKMDKIVERLKL